MAHLMLPNSELIVGTSFGDHSTLRELAASGDAAVLFPAEDTRDIDEMAPSERPRTLVVVDGSWQEARKLLNRNPVIRNLPRVGFTSDRTSHYRIRKEPEPHCLSTIEATVEMLGRLENAPSKFTPMLEAFDYMVDVQLAHWQSAEQRSRYGKRRDFDRRRVLRPLTDRVESLVIVTAEANVHPNETAEKGAPELLQLVARRVSDRSTFEAVLKPLRPLGPDTQEHLELSDESLNSGEPRAEALARFRRFLRADDVLVTWGTFPLDLLAREDVDVAESLDLRLVAANWFRRRPGAITTLLSELSLIAANQQVEGRAGRVLEQADALVRGFIVAASENGVD